MEEGRREKLTEYNGVVGPGQDLVVPQSLALMDTERNNSVLGRQSGSGDRFLEKWVEILEGFDAVDMFDLPAGPDGCQRGIFFESNGLRKHLRTSLMKLS